MVEPLKLFDQLKETYFKQTKTIAVYFATSKFDKVVKKCKNGTYKPVFDDLDTAKQDCIDLEQCLRKYQIEDEEDIYRINEPTMKEFQNTLNKITKRIKSQPEEQFLVILLFAGHGILKQGVQNIVLNEFNPKDGFYKMHAIEGVIRAWANMLQNAYFITIFACCRQTYDWNTMKGYFDAEQVYKEEKKVFVDNEKDELDIDDSTIQEA